MSTLVREVYLVPPAGWARGRGQGRGRSPMVSRWHRLFHLLRGWRRKAVARREFSRLNDRFLRDIGLDRTDVDPHATYLIQDRTAWSRRLLP